MARPLPEEVPPSVYLDCERCRSRTLHATLRGRAGRRGLDVLVKCTRCGTTGRRSVATGLTIKVPLIISSMGTSKRENLEVRQDDELSVGQVVFLGELPVKITALEYGGRRLLRAKASEVGTVWAKRYDRVRVRISVARGRRTKSDEAWLEPSQSVGVGDILDFGERSVLVNSIKVKGRNLRRGSASAGDIVRLYGRYISEEE